MVQLTRTSVVLYANTFRYRGCWFAVCSFQIGFGEWKVFVNDARSRTFLAIAARLGIAQVN